MRVRGGLRRPCLIWSYLDLIRFLSRSDARARSLYGELGFLEIGMRLIDTRPEKPKPGETAPPGDGELSSLGDLKRGLKERQ